MKAISREHNAGVERHFQSILGLEAKGKLCAVNSKSAALFSYKHTVHCRSLEIINLNKPRPRPRPRQDIVNCACRWQSVTDYRQTTTDEENLGLEDAPSN